MAHFYRDRDDWKPLRVLFVYRIFLAIVYLAMFYAEAGDKEFGSYNRFIFAITSHAYFLFVALSLIPLHFKHPSFQLQAHGFTIVDITTLLFLMHANGGIHSGLGILLVITTASIGLLSSRKMALFHPAVATLGLFFETFYANLLSQSQSSYTHAATLGFTLFATGFLTHTLSQRAKKSEALAEQRGDDLESIEQLNDYIVQNMQSGVIALDKNHRAVVINDTASNLLQHPEATAGMPLKHLSPELNTHIKNWLKNPNQPKQSQFYLHGTSLQLQISSIKLGAYRIAIIIQDNAEIMQQMQQMKLASLGRLTASIAHEIRNPLGAISHANQLLNESENLDKIDTRMIEIIQNNTNRVNGIIENVLQLSRRSKSKSQSILLKPWLDEFVTEYVQIKNITIDELTYSVTPEDLAIQFDPSQLHQVLTSLANNALCYGRDTQGHIQLSIIAATDERPYIDVSDHGAGVQQENIQQLFEPFFTTENAGTGLGLYLAKEMSECNYAKLEYRESEIGACFRLTFTPSQDETE